ncbi:acetyl-CoA carboxylase carboxyl transferase subunit alpha [Thermosporothrix hazakensis]|jgi:acetyl-CoA carboxylase carboxyl transferase subunit alpha|uniref:Acetyl-coenzyme A carboxylase carboxyl transferase subunit alpha n=2 Tax=Thermosporothrix TaxID=768650 RepID=A0A326UD28_THEHA|nr:acetyl-CoA carboxylase carboxyltransferase subunit alpha [Thermosporothrix hazakensis]PZW35944.1 acetyl-CoA carboxylase carboxyl transferase subunit alpha [Thermosporothrix hazakensis]BBH88412.1 acetyl-coenzyme A carboxylase carboxyl transferase subunit alpha [Thermosporothrix sp. COM3]GCE46599.1 acetyl-coenzyme A carboxylase carboxyl transferase subunit alpha [Thermosporothrix hazakensis]
MAYDLEFEKPLAELEKKIHSLQRKGDRLKPEEFTQLQLLESELLKRTEEIYSNLNAWQTVQVARHKNRPYTLDYIKLICDDFFELHGDRTFGDDHAIVGGLATIDGQTLMLIGHQKGRDMKEMQYRNLGMPHPEGYRKAQRLMRHAAKFHIPVVTLVDASGASPALVDEERGQAEAIASCLYLMPRLRIPTISIVIGEGGSGGALAISVADRILMLEHSYYTIAAPEAAADILWRDRAQAPLAAEGQRIRARDMLELGIIDGLIAEPLGGAHRNHRLAAESLKQALLQHLEELKRIPLDELLEQRYQKYRNIGHFESAPAQETSPIQA